MVEASNSPGVSAAFVKQTKWIAQSIGNKHFLHCNEKGLPIQIIPHCSNASCFITIKFRNTIQGNISDLFTDDSGPKIISITIQFHIAPEAASNEKCEGYKCEGYFRI
jgi:hypothetical protein